MSTHHLGSSISFFLFGLAISQLFTATLSDIYGRKNILLSALLFSAVSYIFLAFTQTTLIFNLLRLLNGTFCGIIITTIFSIVRENHPKNELAKIISLVATFTSLSPVLSPLIGVSISHLNNWRLIYLTLCGANLILSLVVHLTKSLNKEPSTKKTHLRIYKESITSTLQRPLTRLFIISMATCYAIYMVYLSSITNILISNHHTSPKDIALFIAIGAIPMLIGSRLTSVLNNPGKTIYFILASNLLYSYFLYVTYSHSSPAHEENLTLLLVFSIMINFFTGMLLPYFNSNFLKSLKHYFGTSSAICASFRYGATGITCLFTVKLISNNTAYLFLISTILFTALILISATINKHLKAQVQ